MTNVYDITSKQWRTGLFASLIVFIILHVAAVIGQSIGYYFTVKNTLTEIEKRVSLDLPYIDVGNEVLNTPINKPAIIKYIQRLNDALTAERLPVIIRSIQNVPKSDDHNDSDTDITKLQLLTSEQTVFIHIEALPVYYYWSFSPFSIFAALLISPVILSIRERKKEIKRRNNIKLQPIVAPEPKLVINLLDKTIGNGIDDRTVVLQNKPLCFYTALVKFCIDHPDTQLMHHHDVPAELVQIANKVFVRLIELGHTKRKRPDFNANLDKTLSEIRAGLDDVFQSHLAEKERYYPPRAQGEGSRSKQHSFALVNILAEHVEIIGN